MDALLTKAPVGKLNEKFIDEIVKHILENTDELQAVATAKEVLSKVHSYTRSKVDGLRAEAESINARAVMIENSL